jgi:hypothetical protein
MPSIPIAFGVTLNISFAGPGPQHKNEASVHNLGWLYARRHSCKIVESLGGCDVHRRRTVGVPVMRRGLEIVGRP